MKIHSEHNADTYLHELRQILGSPTDFGVERFTGVILGRFFCITHHCSYEWNRRITCEKNTAIGYVKKSNSGSEIHFLRTKGDLRPQILIPFFLIFAFIAYLVAVFEMSEEHNSLLIFLFLYQFVLIEAVFSAIASSITEEERNGKRVITSLIKNPRDPYGNY